MKYPSTIEFASSKDENKSKVSAGAKSRRPGGSMRKGHAFGCSCGKHPCKCGTEKAKNTNEHCDVNM